MNKRYAKAVLHRLTLRELWRLVDNKLLFLIVALMKLIRASFPLHYAQALPTSEDLLPLEEIQPRALEMLHERMVELERAGFRYSFAYQSPSLGNHVGYVVVSRSEQGPIIAALTYHRDWSGSIVNERTVLTITTDMSDGSILSTSDFKQQLLPPADYKLAIFPGKQIPELIESHRNRLRDQRAAPRGLGSDHEAQQLAFRIERMLFEDLTQRGVLRELTPEEVAQIAPPVVAAELIQPGPGVAEPAAARAPTSPIEPGLTEDGQVLEQIRQLQNRSSSGLSKLVWLVISLALFVGLGAIAWDWKFVLMLIPILAFHELGHYVAMRLLNYQNVSMFFLPLFGAAVKGRNYNAPGWKRALVALMGPVPGILLGFVLGLAGVLLDQELLVNAALLTLLLNALNLIPLLPMDGGWVVQAVLFSRHPRLELVFRIVTVIGLGLLGLLLNAKLLLFLAVFMGITIPTAYRIARISWDLRASGWTPRPTSETEICPVTAIAIMQRIRDSFKHKFHAKQLAQMTMTAYESLTARPPGALATLGFLSLHGGSFVCGLLLIIGFMVARQQDWAGWFGGEQPATMTAVLPETTRTAIGPDFDNRHRSTTLAVDLNGRSEAEAAFAAIGAELPPQAKVVLLGNSLLVALPHADKQGQDAMAARLARVKGRRGRPYRDRSETDESDIRLTLECAAPDEPKATSLAAQLNAYFHAAATGCHVVPPWSSEHLLTEPQLAARRTYAELLQVEESFPETSRMQQIQEQWVQAVRQQDREAEQRLMREQDRIIQLHQAAELARIRARSGVDVAVVDLFSQRLRAESEEDISDIDKQPDAEVPPNFSLELGQALGQLPLEGEKPNHYHLRPTATSGYVSADGSQLHLEWTSFYSPIEGVPALIDWLFEKGCTELHYSFEKP